MKKTFKDLTEAVAKIEGEHSSLENFVKSSTNLNKSHRMKMREAYKNSLAEIEKVYQNLDDLMLADLYDYQKMAVKINGEFV